MPTKNINFKTKVTGTTQSKAKLKSIETAGTKVASTLTTAFKTMGIAMAASFGIAAVGNLVELGNKIRGVEIAFNRLNDPNLLNNLRKATKNTIDDLQLMASATFAEKMRIPMDVLAKGMEFAGLTALETGQDINYMMESFVTGTARQSIMILDNLGISQKELSEEVKRTGDFMTALGNIMDRQLTKMRAGVDDTILRQQKLNVILENQKQMVAVGLSNAWSSFLGAMAMQLGQWIDGIKQVDEWLNQIWRDLGLLDEVQVQVQKSANNPMMWFVDKDSVTVTDQIATNIERMVTAAKSLQAGSGMVAPTTGGAGGGSALSGGGIGGVSLKDETLSRMTEVSVVSGLDLAFDKSEQMMSGVSRSWTSTLESNFNTFWDSTFGYANSLLEQLLKMTFTGILSQALSFLPGGGILGGIISLFDSPSGGGNNNTSNNMIVLKIGDEEVSRFVNRGNEYNRMRRLS